MNSVRMMLAAGHGTKKEKEKKKPWRLHERSETLVDNGTPCQPRRTRKRRLGANGPDLTLWRCSASKYKHAQLRAPLMMVVCSGTPLNMIPTYLPTYARKHSSTMHIHTDWTPDARRKSPNTPSHLASLS